MASIIASSAHCAMAPGSQTEAVVVVFAFSLGGAFSSCAGSSSGNFPRAEPLGAMNICCRLCQETLIPQSGLSPPLLLHASYMLPVLNHLEIPFMAPYIQYDLGLEWLIPGNGTDGVDGSLCHLRVRKFESNE